MKELLCQLRYSPIIYVTRDLERALGLSLNTQGYFIVANYSKFAKSFVKEKKNVILIKEKSILNTRELLKHPKTVALFKKLKNSSVLVFKNTTQIKKICAEHNWKLLNPKAKLANKIEEKISQLTWLGPLKKYLPRQEVMLCKNLPSTSSETHPAPKEYIIQFNRSHTGGGTMLIVSDEPLKELKQKFPNREVRVTEFIDGPAFTLNAVVWGKKILCGNISYQITGLPPFTGSPFATIGNDWALPAKLLSNKQISQIKQIASDVGKRLAKDGWIGLFGIDVMIQENTGKVYLIEINARQPASTTFESQLQNTVILNPDVLSRGEESLSQTRNGQRSFANAQDDKMMITTFEAHLAALLGLPAKAYKLQTITTGAQIIQRVSPVSLRGAKRRGNLLAKKFNVIAYNNTTPGADLLRIQSKTGIMQKHNEFNEAGKNIAKLL